MKKIMIFMLVFALAATALFAVNPVSASANQGSLTANIQQSAPTTIYRTVNEVAPRGDYKYYSFSAHGTVYRGQLPFIGTFESFFQYAGKLYRIDLAYPIYS